MPSFQLVELPTETLRPGVRDRILWTSDMKVISLYDCVRLSLSFNMYIIVVYDLCVCNYLFKYRRNIKTLSLCIHLSQVYSDKDGNSWFEH